MGQQPRKWIDQTYLQLCTQHSVKEEWPDLALHLLLWLLGLHLLRLDLLLLLLH